MIPLTARQSQIMNLLRSGQELSAARIQKAMQTVSLPTVKRDIAALVEHGYLISRGRGRSGGYALTAFGKLFTPMDAHAYCVVEPDLRGGFERFDDTLLPAIPSSIFNSTEYKRLEETTEFFRTRSRNMSDAIARRELERFVIELSWKSSRIEGNTYTLLDTERLIREGVEAREHTHEEAVMILNHKSAFEFAYAHRSEFSQAPSRAAIEELHRLLVQDLNVGRGVRKHVVGIVGTRYRPLDNQFQINEALDALCGVIGRAIDPYTAALTALLGISYIQPFEDGNKRTARMLANAVLLARSCAPLSYRSVDEVAYREATLAFYETHSLVPFKELFVAQYLFAAEQYGIK